MGFFNDLGRKAERVKQTLQSDTEPCPVCGTEFPVDDEYCPDCGRSGYDERLDEPREADEVDQEADEAVDEEAADEPADSEKSPD